MPVLLTHYFTKSGGESLRGITKKLRSVVNFINFVDFGKDNSAVSGKFCIELSALLVQQAIHIKLGVHYTQRTQNFFS